VNVVESMSRRGQDMWRILWCLLVCCAGICYGRKGGTPTKAAAQVPGSDSLRRGAGHDAGRLEVRAVSAVAVDASGNVYTFQRGRKPPRLWSSALTENTFAPGARPVQQPHGIRIDKQDHVWTTDTGYHLVTEFTTMAGFCARGYERKGWCDPEHLQPANRHRVPANGDFFVTDGYRQLARWSSSHEKAMYLMGGARRGRARRVLTCLTPSSSIPPEPLRKRPRNNRIQISMPNARFLGSGRIWGDEGMDINAGTSLVVTPRNKARHSL